MTNNKSGQPLATANWIIPLSAFVMAAIAPVAVLGGKGMVLVLGIGGSAALFELIRRGRVTSLRHPLWLSGLLGAAFLWMFIDGLFLHPDGFNWLVLIKIVTICLMGQAFLVCVKDLQLPHSRFLENALLVGVGAAVIMAGLYVTVLGISGHMLWGSNVANPMASIRPGSGVIAALIWPCLAIVWQRGWRWRLAAALLAAVAAISAGGAAALSLAMGCIAFVVIIVFARKGAVLLVLLSVTVVMVMPALFSHVVTPNQVINALPVLGDSAQHRLYIWEFVGNHVFEKPLGGWGLDASRSLAGGNSPAPVGDALLPLHPHNAAIQIWLELGLPGALIFAGLLGFILLSTAKTPKGDLRAATSTALVVTLMGIAMLSFGIWQSWWLATLWLVGAVGVVFNPSHETNRLSSDRTTMSD